MNNYRRTTLATAIAGSLFSAPALAVNLATDGIGEVAIAPYYTVRDGWSTLINLTNTQNVPIVVKVRVHEALNSRDVLDFNIALSAFDVFTGIIQENENGVPVFRSTDSPNDLGDYTCTIPSGVAVNPDGTRNEEGVELQAGGYVNPGNSSDNDGGPTEADRLREGYVEFIVMGYANGDKDGPLEGGLYGDGKTPIPANVINVGNAIEQHDCDRLDMAFNDADNPATNESHILETARQFGEPINALKFNFRLLNPARGVEAGNAATTWANFFNPSNDDIGLQIDLEPGENGLINPFTVLPLVRPVQNANCEITRGDERRSSSDANPPGQDRAVNWIPGEFGAFTSCQNLITAQREFAFLEPSLNDAYPPMAQWFDDAFDSYFVVLPLENNNAPPPESSLRGVDAVSATILRRTVVNEWSSNADLGVTTDWIITQPTKAFYVDRGFDLDTTDGQQSAITEDRLEAQLFNAPLPYTPYQEEWDKSGEPDGACNDVSFIYYDRAEQTPTAPPGGVIISPAPPIPVETEKLCYETTLITFNEGSAFDEPAPNRIDIDTSGLPDASNGWMFMELDSFQGAFLAVQGAVVFTSFNDGLDELPFGALLRGLPVIGFNLKVRNFGSADANYASSLDHSYTRGFASGGGP